MNEAMTPLPAFSVARGDAIHRAIFDDLNRVVDAVRDAYIAHARNHTNNPDSVFLLFSDEAANRIIALPAHIRNLDGSPVTGLKWIASFPRNIEHDLPRASAVIVLNDPKTGYPFACLEGSVISAARTAASAVLGAYEFNGKCKTIAALGFIGNGVIAQYVLDFFVKTGWRIGSLHAYDLVRSRAIYFAEQQAAAGLVDVRLHESPESLIRACDMTVFATTGATPYIDDLAVLAHNPILLHLSLRDVSPRMILASHNVVDDIDHCLKANTSPHLAEQMTGDRDFVRFTLPAILSGHEGPCRNKPIIFSPFGMGILDLAVGKRVFQHLSTTGDLITIPDFFQSPNSSCS
jgi:ornithine cyclodeaminase